MISDIIEERNQLLALLPDVVWPLVFDHIKNADDLINLADACTPFKGWMKSKRTIYLLPQVLLALDNQRYLTSWDAKDILNCRLACSTWTVIINKFLEMRPYHLKLSCDFNGSFVRDKELDVAYPMCFPLKKFEPYKLRKKIIPEMSLPFYRNHNPFPSRHVDIYQYPLYASRGRRGYTMRYNELKRYNALVEEFFGKVGHHFWHATIDYRMGDVSFYRQSRQLCRLMPNLKSLYMENLNHGDDLDVETAAFLSQSTVLFPSLQNLETIRLIGVCSPVVNAILGRNPYLKIIECYDSCELQISQNVERLAISQEAFEKISNNLPKLQTLYIKSSFGNSPSLPLSILLPKLECFKDTLSEVSVEFPIKAYIGIGWKVNQERSLSPWNMPHLKRLNISIACVFSLDFLLGLKSLQCLYLTVDTMGRKFGTGRRMGSQIETIDFYSGGHSENFMGCNIWELIPSLKIVRLKVGTGHGWQGWNYKTYRRDGTCL